MYPLLIKTTKNLKAKRGMDGYFLRSLLSQHRINFLRSNEIVQPQLYPHLWTVGTAGGMKGRVLIFSKK